MSEDADDSSKTEEPTARKLQKAEEEGQFALSQEVPVWFMVAAVIVMLLSVVPGTMAGLVPRLRFYIESSDLIIVDKTGIGLILGKVVMDVLWALWLPFLMLVFAGITASLAQKGYTVSWKAITPKFTKLNPLNGFKNMFNIPQKGIDLVKSLAKLSVVGIISFIALQPMIDSIQSYVGLDMMALLANVDSFAFDVLLGVFLALIVIAGGDLAWQRMQHNKKMRMTKQEVKDEHKQSEGDPHVKGRIRQLRIERSRQRMMGAVPTADVVVTNPTHFAVALKYDQAQMAAPMVVAKGVDHIALRIRELAKEHDVPIVENPPLARALYATCEIEAEVPADHYRAVAEVITYVFKLKGRNFGR